MSGFSQQISLWVLNHFPPLLKAFLTPQPVVVDRLSGKTALALKNTILILHRVRKARESGMSPDRASCSPSSSPPAWGQHELWVDVLTVVSSHTNPCNATMLQCYSALLSEGKNATWKTLHISLHKWYFSLLMDHWEYKSTTYCGDTKG